VRFLPKTEKAASREGVAFGPFRLFPVARRLEREGVPVKLGGRSLEILLVLVEEAGKVLSKNDLLARVWQDVTVDESTLRVHITRLRQALGEGRDAARYIANISGRGYSFVGEITRLGPASDKGLESAPKSRAAITKSLGFADAPPKPTTNLPPPMSPLIGRELELTVLRDLLERSQMVTLIGIGGIGKTRLAVELGASAISRLQAGVWMVDLAPLSDPPLVPSAVAAVLGVSLTNPENAVGPLAAALGTQPRLLILDHCDSVREAAASLIQALLDKVPTLLVIATSETQLGLPGEQVLFVNPLVLPPASATRVEGSGAVDFFVERARASVPSFQIEDANAADVSEICRRAAGIPLALEIAAARLPMFAPAKLRQQLDEALRLTGPPGDPDTCRRTLRNVVEWSHGLLDHAERQVFRRLASLVGSFTLEAAVAVVESKMADPWDTIDVLSRLIEKAFVTVGFRERPRYILSGPLRLFAGEKLFESSEATANAARHAEYFAGLLESAYESWESEPEPEWRERNAPEIDNFRAALGWAFADPSRRGCAVAMAGAASRVFYYNFFNEAQRFTDAAVELIDDTVPVPAAARLLARAGSMWSSLERERALSLLRRAEALYRESGDKKLAYALHGIGVILTAMDQHDGAREALLEARAILSGSNRRRWLLNVHSALGNLERNVGAYDAARGHYGDAIAVARLMNELNYESAVRQYIAELEFKTGNIGRAIELGRDAVAGMRRASWPIMLAATVSNLTSYLLAAGNVAEGREFALEALSLTREIGGFALRFSLLQWALIGAREGRLEAAARLSGYVDEAVSRNGDIYGATESHIRDQLQNLLATTLPAEDRQSLAAEGAGWSEAEAVALVIEYLIVQKNSDA
jgi:predicted ATPase/DNA-binding winged helix-turn-helix (wHTH) protein